MVELALDGGKIVEDVCMIELKIIEDGGTRPVMHEFGALIEESGVVLVCLDNEVLTPGKTRRDREVVGNSANEKARVAPTPLEDPRQHGRSRGLAVSAGDSQHVALDEYLLGQPLRA